MNNIEIEKLVNWWNSETKEENYPIVIYKDTKFIIVEEYLTLYSFEETLKISLENVDVKDIKLVSRKTYTYKEIEKKY